METFKQLLDELHLDFTNTVLLPDIGLSPEKEPFELSSNDFFRFAQEDIRIAKENNENETPRGYINAVSNSKRAIDCKADEVLQLFGIDLEKNEQVIDSFLSNFEYGNDNIKKIFKLIQSLNLAPSGIIAQTRKIRHRLEHDYEKPTIEEVQQILDVAELFLNSVNRGIETITSYSITDNNNLTDDWRYMKGFNVAFFEDIKAFQITFKDHEIFISDDDKEFYPLLRLTNSIPDQSDCIKSIHLLIKPIIEDMSFKHVKLTIK